MPAILERKSRINFILRILKFQKKLTQVLIRKIRMVM